MDLIQVNNLPAALTQFGSDDAFEDMIVSGNKIPRLSIKGRQFTEVSVDGLRMPIKSFEYPLVIMGISPKGKHFSKSYYEQSFGDESEGKLPTCFSHDGVRPDASVEAKQSNLCATCPNNAWGSAIKQDGTPGKGKKCSDSKTIFFMKAKPGPDGRWLADLEGDLWQLRVPATSMKSMSDYARMLKQRKISPMGLVTKLEFLDGVSHPQLVFGPCGLLTDDHTMKALIRSQSEEVIELVGRGEVYEAPVEKEPDPMDAMLDQAAALQEATQEPLPEPQEPKPQVERGTPESPEIDLDVDSSGTVWNAELHSANKSTNADGTWRKKKKAKVQETTPEPKQEPAPSVFEEKAPVAESADDLDELLAGLDF